MPPPPASNVASRLFLGPALRAQPDWRLVKLVREGYENAFDEIVRRYGKPLIRYAAAIVSPNRAEDVTQDAFSKALLALRGTDKEIELRPWLYRIVRNTALNDIRDQPPPAARLHEGIDGVETPAEAAERRAELADLLERLRALPDPQRAAIVMRELEGLSHEEIAGALGISGGGARQAIYRARRTLRNGAGMLVPLPLLQYLLGGGAATGAGLAGAGSAGLAAGTGGAGAGAAIKAGLATVLVVGSVAGGVALHHANRQRGANVEAAGAAGDQAGGASVTPPLTEVDDISASGLDDDHGGRGPGHRGGEAEPGDDHGGGPRESSSGPGSGSGHQSRESRGGPGGDDRAAESQPGSGGSGSGTPEDDSSSSSSGTSSSGSSGEGSGDNAPSGG